MKNLAFDENELLKQYNPDFAMAYGSGVFQQEGYTDKDKPLIDFIFGAESTTNWHEMNVKNNSSDYWWLTKLLGQSFINRLQEIDPKIYYNPFVKFDANTIKYGIISLDDLVQDLKEWKYLYTAGRLQKPVQILKTTSEVEEAMEINFKNAVNTALLLLPENFTERDLFITIAGLSYTGDSRMAIGENPDKVKNIVDKNIDGFKQLYDGVVLQQSNLAVLNNGNIQQDKKPTTILDVYSQLPKNLKDKIDAQEFEEDEFVTVIQNAIGEIVNGPSKGQTIKGILTSGPVKSVRYAGPKIMKKVKSLRNKT